MTAISTHALRRKQFIPASFPDIMIAALQAELVLGPKSCCIGGVWEAADGVDLRT